MMVVSIVMPIEFPSADSAVVCRLSAGGSILYICGAAAATNSPK
jgi:hypothetical protein